MPVEDTSLCLYIYYFTFSLCLSSVANKKKAGRKRDDDDDFFCVRLISLFPVRMPASS
jgi:hypothetical protein